MAMASRDDTRGRFEAACDNLVDIENINSSGELDIYERASKLNTEKSTSSLQDIKRVATKDTKEEKYIDQANLYGASQIKRETNTVDGTQSSRLQCNKTEDRRKEEKLSGNETPETEKEGGNYEELVCLVRQFYVERPVNPAAIAYQNIETC